MSQLVQGIFLRFLTHPFLSLYALSKSRAKILHEFLHTFLVRSGKILGYIEFAYALPQHTLHGIDCLFPTRIVFLGSHHKASVEIEILGTKSIREEWRSSNNQLILEIILLVINRSILNEPSYFPNSFRLPYNHICCSTHVKSGKQCVPVNIGIILLQLGNRHLVVVAFRITKFDTAAGSLGNASLQFHHGFHLL